MDSAQKNICTKEYPLLPHAFICIASYIVSSCVLKKSLAIRPRADSG